MVRVVVLLAALVACGTSEAPIAKPTESVPAPRVERSKWRPRVTPPGLRLPDTVAPLDYKLRLEIDPDRDTFRGHVDIRARVSKGIDVLWLHAKELEITRASVRVGSAASETLTIVPERGDEMLGFTAGRMIYPGEIVLAFDYTGHVRDDTNGLFRQQADKKWFVYSQGQAVFTRLFVPCFDEPRFKTPWQLSVVVPKDDVALSNAPPATEQLLADGRKEITFEKIGPLPSYLVALAVGPFTLVDGGRIGQHGTPFRIAVWPSRAADVKHAVKRVSKLLQELESYVDQRMPWPKLDFVAVPQFFGAMENVGLVTFESHILFDESDGEYGFARVAAHELVHQFFGNLVTPAWWDELWMSEAFASFLGDKIAELAGETRDPLLAQQLARAEALAADATNPLPLRRAVAGNASVDDTFDEIAYQKGASVLATFDAYLPPDAFRTALRSLLRTHTNGTITTESFVDAVRAVDARAADAATSYALRAGPPIVELALDCTASPRVIATARDGAVVPVCVRYPGAGGPSRACAVVAERTEIPLAATACPTWIAGNAGGTGYYEAIAAKGASLPRVLDKLLPAERFALGADAATAMTRAELPTSDALALAKTLLAMTDPYARLGGTAIARALDPLVDDATRPAWRAWLAKQLPRRDRPTSPAERELAATRAELVPLILKPKVFDILVDTARKKTGDDQRTGFAVLGSFGADTALRIVDLVLDPSVPSTAILQSVYTQLGRNDSRTASWRALRAHLPAVMARIAPRDARDLVSATGSLCDAAARAEVLAAFEPRARDIPDGATALAAALASIDRCVARSRVAADLKSVLRAL